jgi:hypothetical protein
MNGGENIVKWTKGQRVSWLGHLERMEEDRMPKKIFTQELEGTRRRGRPRKGWKEGVERDLQVLGVRRWRELVTDRKKMEGYCSTGQSPQRTVVPMEKKKNTSKYHQFTFIKVSCTCYRVKPDFLGLSDTLSAFSFVQRDVTSVTTIAYITVPVAV